MRKLATPSADSSAAVVAAPAPAESLPRLTPETLAQNQLLWPIDPQNQPHEVVATLGEVRGSEKPDEYVVLGAHLDSWDLGQGTTDNGTGSSVILEAARVLAHSSVQPKRTIRFVLFTGEEQGFHGSRAYVKDHESELPRISMVLAHDTGTGRVTGIGLQGRDVLKPIFESELVSLKDLGLKEINLRSMGGTDHVPFDRAGVPGFAPALRQAASSLAAIACACACCSAVVMQAPNGSATATINRSRETCMSIVLSP